MKGGMNNCWGIAAHSAGAHLAGSSRPRRSFPLRAFGTFGLKPLPLKAGGPARPGPARLWVQAVAPVELFPRRSQTAAPLCADFSESVENEQKTVFVPKEAEFSVTNRRVQFA